MARPLRFEEEGGIYHVLNRGNYRAHVFASEGAKHAFLKTLGETCEKTGWVIHAWALMSNHYHLAVETPRGNLVDGMRQLQGVFATRFNRLRHENGHIFQGRYKSLVVESEERLGGLCHYIHLNPVRAGLCTVGDLGDWRWTSMHWLFQMKRRATWYRPDAALLAGRQSRDTPSGRKRYLAYLAWLTGDETARRELKFEEMSRGWILGSKQFKNDLLQAHKQRRAYVREAASNMQSAIEGSWSEELDRLLKCLGKSGKDIDGTLKSAEWKVAIAAMMKTKTTATNRWLAEQLKMGSLYEVSRLTSRWNMEADDKLLRRLKTTTNHKA